MKSNQYCSNMNLTMANAYFSLFRETPQPAKEGLVQTGPSGESYAVRPTDIFIVVSLLVQNNVNIF